MRVTKQGSTRLKTGLLMTAALGVGLALSPMLETGAQADDRSPLNTYQQLDLFGEVFERIRAEYVEDISDKELIDAAISGMLSSLDPHSSYLDPDNYQNMQTQTRGSFGGLGIEVSMEDGLVRVVSPIDDTPAYHAGIQAGDFISHIDGDPVTEMDLSDAVDRMRGPVGTSITVTILRGDSDPFDVEIERDTIQIQSVRWRTEGDMGYIRVTSFTQQTTTEVEEAVHSIEEELGDRFSGLVIDLRNNPGGLFDQSVSMADLFLNQGEIVSTRPRDESRAQRFNATDGALAEDVPIVVLINAGSASSSEIVAGALQDQRRALVLGTDSYGKGSVQSVIPLAGNGAMRLTTARHYTPSGRSIQATGIEPDILVPQARIEELDTMFRREADLRNALRNTEIGPLPVPGEEPPAPESEEDGVSPVENNGSNGGDSNGGDTNGGDSNGENENGDDANGEEASALTDSVPDDYQLARALDILKGIALFRGTEMR
jgi:carboxyl-terminal processing protease